MGRGLRMYGGDAPDLVVKRGLTSLLNREGSMPCLGFYCFQIGRIHISVIRGSEETCILFEDPGLNITFSPILKHSDNSSLLIPKVGTYITVISQTLRYRSTMTSI